MYIRFHSNFKTSITIFGDLIRAVLLMIRALCAHATFAHALLGSKKKPKEWFVSPSTVFLASGHKFPRDLEKF